MAQNTNGILGPVNGKIGPVVGVQWRGQNILRSAPQKTTKQASKAQLLQRTKMALAAQFLAPCKAVVANCCTGLINGKSFSEVALSNLLKNAIYLEGEQFYIRFNKVFFTLGYLPSAKNTLLDTTNTKELTLTWINNSDNGITNEEDLLSLIIYNETEGIFYNQTDCADRKDGSATIELPQTAKESILHIWSIWRDTQKTHCSTSLYIGTLIG